MLLPGFCLLMVSPWLAEGNWQLKGFQFSTKLAEQWSGYGMMLATFLAAAWQAFSWFRLKRFSFWPQMLLGGYAAVFALVKWFRYRELNAEFQQVAGDSIDHVSAGAGLYLLFSGGILLLVSAFSLALPQRLKMGKT